MKKEEITAIWKLAKFTWIGGFVFWIIETLIFLIIDGWHIKPTNPIEILCDNTVSFLWKVASFLTIYVAYYSIKFLNKKE